MRTLFLSLLLLAASGEAHSQNDCSSYIHHDTVAYESDLSLKLAVLQTFTQENFSQRKRDFGAGLTMPIEGIPIEAFANYSDFDESRSRALSHYQYNMNFDKAEAYLSSRVSNASLEAVKDCIVANMYGLNAALDSVTSERVDISFYWRPTPGAKNKIDPLTYVITGGKEIGNLPKSINANSWESISLSRDTNKDLVVRIKGGGNISDVFVVPAIPVIVPQTYTWTFGRQKAPLRFDPDKWDSNIFCDDGATISGVHQNGDPQEDNFRGRTSVKIMPRHSINPDKKGWHYSRVLVNGSSLLSKRTSTPLGYRLNTIQVTCNP